MDRSFAPLRRTLAAFACLSLASGALLAAAQTAPQPPPGAPQTTLMPTTEDNGSVPAGGKFKECHGYVRHVSTANMKVHCIDGNPSDQSFLYVPKFAKLTSGKTIETTMLKPDTPVHVYYTQSLGIKKAYRVYVDDTNGTPLGSVKT